MLQVERLSVSREKGERPAPRGLSFEILPGRIVGVAGRNGSGKTSLALVLAGILPRVVGGEWTGHVQFSGLALAAVGWPTSVRAAYSCQDQTSGALLGRLDDVLVSFPDDIRDLSQNLPLPHARTEIQHLSSGQKHIFDWVLCQARRPQILIMDEGLSSLDPVTATSLIQGSRNLKGFGDRVALLIDQDANRLKAHADAIISIPHQSTPTTTDNLSPVRLGAIMWRSHASEDARTERSMTTISARWPNASGQQRFAVPDFCLEAGTASLVKGRVGAGKSTVLKALSGVPGPIGDREMRKVHDLWRPVYVGADDHFVVAHASIQSVLAAAVGSSNVDQVWQALTQFLPGKSLQTDPGTLSFGQRRLLAILALIARSERAVVLDEPDKGLDERAQGLMIGLVCAFLASGGAVALASHNAGFLDRCRCAISAWRSFEVEAQEWR